jgi:hypothetical protein
MQRGTRNVDISKGVQTTSRESDRNLMAPVWADSFLTARGSTVLEVIALMVGGSKYLCLCKSWVCFSPRYKIFPQLMPALTCSSIHDMLIHVSDHIQPYGSYFRRCHTILRTFRKELFFFGQQRAAQHDVGSISASNQLTRQHSSTSCGQVQVEILT